MIPRIFCFLSLCIVSCSAGYILTTKDATKFLLDWKRDFDMNFGFQLRKMGIVQSNRRSKDFGLLSLNSFIVSNRMHFHAS